MAEGDKGKVSIELLCTDDQQRMPLTIHDAQSIVEIVLGHRLDPGKYILNLIYTDDAEMTALNKHYRKLPKTTDVLSFGYLEDNAQWDQIDEEPPLIGEIFFSAEQIEIQAKLHHHLPSDEMAYLLIHALLHLDGMDHDADQLQAKAMEEEQDRYFLIYKEQIRKVTE